MSNNQKSIYQVFIGLVAGGAFLLAIFCPKTSLGQTIRNYNANFTTNNIVADGVISPGEWDGAEAAAGDWRELRNAFTDVDQDNNRFQVLWDNDNLYVLYETDYDFGWLNATSSGSPNIRFGQENLNLYLDPNNDGDLNMNPVTETPSDPNASHVEGVDGYQLAFNQYSGTHISVDGDFDGIGIFTEAHVDASAGDQGNWSDGPGNAGSALIGSNIVIGQTNTNPSGGVAEIIIPFADLDADAMIDDPDNPGEMKPTGLNATAGVTPGDTWGFNLAQITRDTANNFLPVWNWHDGQAFARWPHGTLTFIGDSAPDVDLDDDLDVDGTDFLLIQRTDSSLIPAWSDAYGSSLPLGTIGVVPEPASLLLILSTMAISLASRRR